MDTLDLIKQFDREVGELPRAARNAGGRDGPLRNWLRASGNNLPPPRGPDSLQYLDIGHSALRFGDTGRLGLDANLYSEDPFSSHGSGKDTWRFEIQDQECAPITRIAFIESWNEPAHAINWGFMEDPQAGNFLPPSKLKDFLWDLNRINKPEKTLFYPGTHVPREELPERIERVRLATAKIIELLKDSSQLRPQE